MSAFLEIRVRRQVWRERGVRQIYLVLAVFDHGFEQVEFETFQSQLTELRHDVARAEARLQQIIEKTSSR